MTKEKTLKMFASRSDIREWMLRPFRLNGYVYASNGHWIVRLPDDASIDADPVGEHHPKKLESMFAEAASEGFKPLPEMKKPDACNTCEGKGTGTEKKCHSCDGKGEFEHYGYDYECQACDGNGSEFFPSSKGADPCPHCDGLGIQQLREGLACGDAKFSPRYLWLLKSLPGIQIATNGTDKAGHFIFEGGDGLLMPYRD